MKKEPYLTIETQAELDAYCHDIIHNPEIDWIAIDTEFIRVDTYFPELSLVQIQDCLGQAALIDPIAIMQNATASNNKPDELIGQTPLSSLVDLLTDPNTLKVFHSARQDIEVLYQLANKMPASIFDTQLAALFFKHGEMAGFARVIEAELGHLLDKSQTRTNWHSRPLTQQQIEYALDDVRFLSPLYQKFIHTLTPEQRKALTEDCQALLDETLYKPNPSKAGDKIKGTQSLKPKQLAIVERLATWREHFAITENQPKKWVMSDEVIIDIAKRPPQTLEALYKVPLIKASSVKLYGAQWIKQIDDVFAQAPETWPQLPAKKPALNLQQSAVVDFCFSYAQQVSLEYGLNIQSLIHKDDIQRLMCDPYQPVLKGWRQLLIGQPLQALLQGKQAIKFHNSVLLLHPL
ncbi:ribonuclease D [Thiomicrorhabdus aquaedulcis]|uniref:ribonuclease D n=1 Tax=Thiomicrorhabdus aquaedulcis TaxID=2211106 RepID=UPI000FD726EF|nr:HRDC domain-containing protein [Thiomicrorhabdus aquaedulcis]